MNPSAHFISAVDSIIRGRRSMRRYLPTAVSKETVREILELAARAPSGTNVQPWKVYALSGKNRDALCEAVTEKFMAEAEEGIEFDYYPKEWVEPWLSRRRKVGFYLYGLLGIAKGDKESMKKQSARNFCFFDAPIGLIFTLDRALGNGMLMDYGMFMANLMIAARARGLDTCTQAVFANYPKTIRKVLDIPENELIICGMALGYADPDAPENRLITERVPVEDFADFRGFEV